MAKPAYVEEMCIGDFCMTSVVCDKEEFDANILSLRNLAPDDVLQAIIKAGHLPLCAKGTKTVHLFEKYGIKTDKLAMIVRSKGPEILQKMLNTAQQLQGSNQDPTLN